MNALKFINHLLPGIGLCSLPSLAIGYFETATITPVFFGERTSQGAATIALVAAFECFTALGGYTLQRPGTGALRVVVR